MGQALNDLREALEGQQEAPIQGMPTNKPDMFRDLEVVAKTLNKRFKTDNSIVRMGNPTNSLLPSIPTGLMTVDFDVLGCGGIPRGRFTELYGPESSGKTSIALQVVAQEQRLGGIAAYIDVEHSLDPAYASMLGVDMAELLVSQPDSGEQALETVDALVETGLVKLIIIDSVAALVPQSELEGDMGDANMGAQARLMSQACRKLRGKCNINKVALIWINQIRHKIGVMFGSPEVTSGGKALAFYASIRLDIRRKEVYGPKDAPTGHQICIKAIKNKVGMPKHESLVDLIYGQGLDVAGDLINYAKNTGVIEQKGAWLYFNGERLGNGLANVKEQLKGNPELFSEVVLAVNKEKHAVI